uniref:Uncharacterized protein n=1 Tax=Nelumbo nucifera TaxID=4432 RepID=A0A822XV17_NELNU|nr:TPA_asm: hypothetical protein HUJ06_024108 [Nelumbo nucifera]
MDFLLLFGLMYLITLSSLLSISLFAIPSESQSGPQQPIKPGDFSGTNTVPTFPIQTQAQTCHLNLSEELFSGISEACERNLEL